MKYQENTKGAGVSSSMGQRERWERGNRQMGTVQVLKGRASFL